MMHFNKLFRSIYFLVVAFYTTITFAMEDRSIREVDSWIPIMDYIATKSPSERKSTLVVTDLDNTLFGSVATSRPTLFPADFKWMKSQTAGLIGSTTRSLERDLTISQHQLSTFGIAFTDIGDIDLSGYDNGCIYYDPRNPLTKGESLKEYILQLRQRGINIQEVIFVDDMMNNIESVQEHLLPIINVRSFHAHFNKITPPIHEEEFLMNNSPLGHGITMSQYYERIDNLNNEMGLTYSKRFETDHYPPEPYNFGDSAQSVTSDDYKALLTFDHAFYHRPTVLCAHAFNPASINRVLAGYFTQIFTHETGEISGALTDKQAITLAPFCLSIRALISSSLIDLEVPETLKTTSPYGALFHVPWETIYDASAHDAHVPMENQGGGFEQTSFIKGLYKKTAEKPTLSITEKGGEESSEEDWDIIKPSLVRVIKELGFSPINWMRIDPLAKYTPEQLLAIAQEMSKIPELNHLYIEVEQPKKQLRISFHNTLDEILNSYKISGWNEVAFYPRIINPHREPRLVAFFIDSRKTRAGHTMKGKDQEITQEELKDYFKILKNLGIKLNIPVIDFADYEKK